MAKLITEIGSDSSGLRKDVGSLPGVVKSNFDKMKKASEGGIVDNTKKLQRNFNNLKTVLTAGGVAVAVSKFYSMAMEEAKKAADAGNEVAKNAVELGDKLSALKSIGAGLGVGVFGTLNIAANSLRDGFINIGALLTGNLGELQKSRDVLDETGRAADAAARSLAESKKHAAEWNRLNSEARQFANQRVEAERKSLPLADQRNILEQQLLESQRAEAEVGASNLDRRRAQVEQLKIGNQLMEVQKSLDAETTKEMEKRRQHAEAERKITLEALDIRDREKIIRDEILALQTALKSGVLSLADTDKFRNTLAARQLELQQTLNKAVEQEAALRKSAMGSVDDELFMYEALKKGVDNLFGAERARFELLQDIAWQKRYEKEFQDLTEKGLDNLNDKELARYEYLAAQIREIDKQVKAKKQLIDNSEKQTTEEGKVRDAIAAQVGELTKQGLSREQIIAQLRQQGMEENNFFDVIYEATEKVYKLNDAWDGFQVKLSRTGQSAEDQSTLSLEGALSRAKSELQRMSNDTSFASVWAPNGKNPLFYTLQMEVQRMENELNMRQRVGGFAAKFGEEATRFKFGDTVTDRALRDMQDDATRTRNALEEINERLKASGLFGRRSL